MKIFSKTAVFLFIAILIASCEDNSIDPMNQLQVEDAEGTIQLPSGIDGIDGVKDLITGPIEVVGGSVETYEIDVDKLFGTITETEWEVSQGISILNHTNTSIMVRFSPFFTSGKIEAFVDTHSNDTLYEADGVIDIFTCPDCCDPEPIKPTISLNGSVYNWYEACPGEIIEAYVTNTPGNGFEKYEWSFGSTTSLVSGYTKNDATIKLLVTGSPYNGSIVSVYSHYCNDIVLKSDNNQIGIQNCDGGPKM